jgi:hypothetical protein
MRVMLQKGSAVLLTLTAIIAPIQAVLGQGSWNKGPFAPAEVIPEGPARCHEIKDMIRDVPTPSGLDRVDFSGTGALSLVHFDGVLAYMDTCNEPVAIRLPVDLRADRRVGPTGRTGSQLASGSCTIRALTGTFDVTSAVWPFPEVSSSKYAPPA